MGDKLTDAAEYNENAPNRPAENLSRVILGAFIFSLTVFQGLTINLMPLLFGTAADSFAASLYEQGQLQSFFLAGGMLGLLLSGYITERIGSRRSGILAVELIGLGLLFLGLSGRYYQMLAASAVVGLGNMWILAAYSAVITAHFPNLRQRMFMFATAVFAGSSALGSVLLGYLLECVPDWRTVFLASAGMVGAWLAAFYLLARRRLYVLDRTTVTLPQKMQESGSAVARLRQAADFIGGGLFNRGTFWLLAVIVILDVVAAGNIIAWTGRYFQTEYGAAGNQAGLVLAASSAGVFFGRVLMGALVSGRIGDRPLLGMCYAAGILMYVLILVVPGYTLGLVLVFLNGAFIAAQAPTMYAITSAKFGRRAATAIPLIDAIGICCGFATPAIVGALADRFGLGTVLWFIPSLGFILVAIVFAWEFFDRTK